MRGLPDVIFYSAIALLFPGLYSYVSIEFGTIGSINNNSINPKTPQDIKIQLTVANKKLLKRISSYDNKNNSNNAVIQHIYNNNNSKIEETTEISNFYYIHVPKTGTSLFTVLRNRLPSCPIKHFTCLDWHGGGVLYTLSDDGKNHFPYTIETLNLTSYVNNSNSNYIKETIENCNNALNCNTRRRFHCPYRQCKNLNNKVTMYRDPYKWYPSLFNQEWINFHYNERYAERHAFDYNYEKPIVFTTSTTNTTEAYDILNNNYVFWGITDYWITSVCIFHCELGGDWYKSEIINSRSAGKFKDASIMEETLEEKYHRKSYITDMNMTNYIATNYPEDIEFYYDYLLPRFYDRASKCNCLY